jgi:hypothetical protein
MRQVWSPAERITTGSRSDRNTRRLDGRVRSRRATSNACGSRWCAAPIRMASSPETAFRPTFTSCPPSRSARRSKCTQRVSSQNAALHISRKRRNRRLRRTMHHRHLPNSGDPTPATMFTWRAVDPADGSVNVIFLDRRDGDGTKTGVTPARSVDAARLSSITASTRRRFRRRMKCSMATASASRPAAAGSWRSILPSVMMQRG